MSHICSSCYKEFASKQNLNYHITHGACRTPSVYCKFCGKGFTAKSNLCSHIKINCKVKKQNDDEKAQIYNRLLILEEENKKLKKEVVLLKKTSKITNNITNINSRNTNNINNGIVANINLIGYGKEDLSKIDKNEIIKAIKHGFNSTIKLTETLHFNPKHPEYHNIYITNMKDKYAMIYDGKDWNLTMKDNLINKIYDDKKNYIEENIDDFVDSLSVSRKNALERWLVMDEEDEKIHTVKNEIKLLLYNKRNVIIDKQEDKVNVATKSIKKIFKHLPKDEMTSDE